MAVMIPDSCPSRATAGEKRTHGLLRDLLPDNLVSRDVLPDILDPLGARR